MDRMNEHADLFDMAMFDILAMYEDLTDQDASVLVMEAFNDFDVVTAIDLHSCNEYHAATTYGLHASIKSSDRQCKTRNLTDAKPTERGKWQTFDGFALGNCNNFLINVSHIVCPLIRSLAKIACSKLLFTFSGDFFCC